MSYIPCAYAPILDEILRRSPGQVPARGQGGHWEATPPDIYLALIRLAASLSSFMARELKTTFGVESRKLVRDAAAGYGRYRGEAIRRTVERAGLPLDLPHMWANWDLPVTSDEEEERMNDDLEPGYHGYELAACPFNDVYQLWYPADLRALHCEAMHAAAFKAFNPAIDLWFPALMPRGEGRCIFRMRMPPDEVEKLQRRCRHEGPEPARGVDDAPTSYRLLARQVVVIYHYFMDTLLSAAGPEVTEAVLRRALAAWGAWRGREMQAAHLAKGWPLDLLSFVTYHDDPAAGEAWVAENVVLSAHEYRLEITRSAWSDLFDELATGRLAAIFCEEALPAQARAYNSQITMTIPRLKERGDAVSEFHYILNA